jgi:hypothetical protein
MTAYNRGSGGSTLTLRETEYLSTVVSTIEKNIGTLGEGALGYNTILNDI